MSNPTMATRIDYKPLNDSIFSAIIDTHFGTPETSESLFSKRFYSADKDGSHVMLRLSNSQKSLSIEPRGEPGWTTLFEICRDYSRASGVQMAMRDLDYAYYICVDGDSTPEQIYATMQTDPYEAERKMKELGYWTE